MAGVTNPRLEAERAQKALADAKARKAEVAAAAKRAMGASSSSSSSVRASSQVRKRPASAMPGTATSNKFSATTASHPMHHHIASPSPPPPPPHIARPTPPVPVAALPPCTCTNSGCREEFRVLYHTLASHLEAANASLAMQAELRKENAFLRKQLQLYRMEGVPVSYQETLMGGGSSVLLNEMERQASMNGRPPSSSSTLRSPSASTSGAYHGAMEVERPQSLSRSASNRPPSLFTGPAEDDEPRFVAPLSLSSPSNRLRAFGGAGSERLDLSAPISNLTASFARQASLSNSTRNGLDTPSRAGTRSSFDLQAEREDLVTQLNGPPSSTHPIDRRTSDAHMAATQEFSIGYA